MPIRARMPISGAIAKLTIGSTDDPELEVSAQYNPSQLERSRTVPWKPHNSDNRPDPKRKNSTPNDLEFTGAEGRELTLDLLFDGFETSTCVEPQLEALDVMATVRDGSEDADEEHRRPHQCVVVWGSDGIKPMRCVIESLAVKYSVFDANGRPLRAVATVKLREATVTKFINPLPSEHPATKKAKAWATRQIAFVCAQCGIVCRCGGSKSTKRSR